MIFVDGIFAESGTLITGVNIQIEVPGCKKCGSSVILPEAAHQKVIDCLIIGCDFAADEPHDISMFIRTENSARLQQEAVLPVFLWQRQTVGFVEHAVKCQYAGKLRITDLDFFCPQASYKRLLSGINLRMIASQYSGIGFQTAFFTVDVKELVEIQHLIGA